MYLATFEGRRILKVHKLGCAVPASGKAAYGQQRALGPRL